MSRHYPLAVRFVPALLISILIPSNAARGALVQATPVPLWDVFPRNTQGENGIFLQRRDAGTSNYVDLVYTKDFQWMTPDVQFGVPAVFRDPAPLIFAHPAAVNGTGFDRDAVMSVQLDGSAFPAVHVTGGTTTGAAKTVGFYIYIGADNWNAPIFESGPGQAIDLTIAYAPGDRLYFATKAIGTDVNAWAKWDNVQITGVPEPAAGMCGVMTTALACARCFPRRQRPCPKRQNV
jgi:hypothetical protein